MSRRMSFVGFLFGRYAMVLACAGVALLLVLAGCGSASSGEGPSGAQEEVQQKEGAFEGRKKRAASELDEFVEKAYEVLSDRQSNNPKDADEDKLSSAQISAFKKANEAYRAGKYPEAQEAYEGIIGEYAEHYGANVNLTLALLQQQKNEDALVQALVCVGLYPSDPGPLLNVQTAAVACRFSAEDALTEAALTLLHKVKAGSNLAKGMENQRQYNRLWDTIEIALHDAAQGTASEGDYVYKSLLEDVDKLAEGDLADDDDVKALRSYLVAVGTQLGLASEDDAATKDTSAADKDTDKAAGKDADKDADKDTDKDASKTSDKDADKDADKDTSKDADKKAKEEVDLSKVQAHAGLPYVVADDEFCTIVFTGYHMSGDSPVAEFQFVNNSSDALSFYKAGEVTGNGKTIENLSAAWPAVDPGEQESAWGSFFATENGNTVTVLDGDLKSLSFAIKVRKKGTWKDEDILGLYPFKWEADAKKVAKKADTTFVEDEGGVTMRVTSVLPASDGIVAVEYWASYKGEGKAFIDGKDWKANDKDVTLLGVGSPMGTGVGYHYLLFHAANADDLKEGAIDSLTGTLILRDADGKELVNKQVKL